MAPHIFYRVEDEDSRAHYEEGRGIFAEDTKTKVYFATKGSALKDQIRRHLDWRNRKPTPFISAYSEEYVARIQANLRVDQGKEDVWIYKIDMNESNEHTEYRNIKRLATRLKYTIEDRAYNNAKYEWIFLHHIPESAVVYGYPV